MLELEIVDDPTESERVVIVFSAFSAFKPNICICMYVLTNVIVFSTTNKLIIVLTFLKYLLTLEKTSVQV